MSTHKTKPLSDAARARDGDSALPLLTSPAPEAWSPALTAPGLSAHRSHPPRSDRTGAPRTPQPPPTPPSAGALRGGAEPGAGLLLDLLTSVMDQHLRSVPFISGSKIYNVHTEIEVFGQPKRSI